MTVDVEERITTALREWAASVNTAPADLEPAVAGATRRQRRQRVSIGVIGVAAAVLIGLLFAGTGRPTVRTASNPDGVSADITRWVLPEWTTTYFYMQPNGAYVEYKFEKGDLRLQLSVYAAGTDRAGGESRTVATVRGGPGSLLDYGSGRYRVDWDEGGRVLEADGGPFGSDDAFIATVDTLSTATEEGWRASLPAGTVLPDERPAAVNGLLDGVPVPEGFDRAALEHGPAASPYDLAADVYGHVACAWIDRWGGARTAGDAAAVQEAADALAGSHQWPGLAPTTAQGAYADVLWDLADRVVAGDATVLDGYHQALGC